MKPAPIPENESARLQSLAEYKLWNTLPEEVYDNITRIASEICGTPIALITLIGEDRQWFKSKQGFNMEETPREYSFCAHAIIDPNEVFVVEDARYDERFYDNPLTTGEPHVVFYAGVPVKSADGHALGTLCVIDSRPRELTEQKMESLKALSKLVQAHFELRKAKAELEETESRLTLAKPIAGTIWNEVQNLVRSGQIGSERTQIIEAADSLQAIFNKV